MTTVTDADREAAMAREVSRGYTQCTRNKVLRGDKDEDELVQAFARHREQAILEGMEIMREAAIDWLKAMDGYGEWWEAAQLIHDNLAASAILAAHTRAKAMDELIAGDADLYDSPPVG